MAKIIIMGAGIGGISLDYDYLVIATGPKLAFDEVEGLGPDGGFTQSICKTGHAATSFKNFKENS